MTPERIREMRSLLGITQEDLAVILGVTKTSVGRYETGMVKPAGDAEKKLLQLDAALKSPEQERFLHGMVHSSSGKAAGAAALAGALSLGITVIPKALLGAAGVGLFTALASPAGKVLFEAMKRINSPKEDQNDRS